MGKNKAGKQLTLDAIDKMKAGRTLDGLIATHVLHAQSPADHVFNPPHAACVVCLGWAPQCSTRIEDAFKYVVGEHFMTLYCLGEKTWHCDWLAESPNEVDVSAAGSTAPEAICRAALKAVVKAELKRNGPV